MLESEEELKSLLVKVQEESEKDGLRLDIQKTKIKASSPNTSWQTHGEIWKQWQILFSRLPKSLQMVTAAMRLKGIWFLGRKVFGRKKVVGNIFWKKSLDESRQRIKKQRHHFANITKVHTVKAMVFPEVMYICECWTIKKAEC